MGEKRDAYVEKLKAQIDKWNADIDGLQAKANKAGAEAKVKMQKHIDELKAKRQELEEKMKPIQKAGGEAWEDLRSGANQALKALGEAIESAKTRFK